MTDLTSSAQALLAQFVNSKQETHVDIDVWRVLRDQASLLYEKQVCVDALTQDVMQQLSEYATEVKRIQKTLQVVSCHRVVTQEGYSSITAVVQLEPTMSSSSSSLVQLTFSYERRAMREEDIVDDSISPNGTHIQYTIEVSKDHGEKQRLLVVECWAVGQGPSQEPAVPMDGWDDMEEDEEGEDAMETSKEEDSAKKSAEAAAPESSDGTNNVDRFAAFMDEEVIDQFKKWTGLETMDEGPIFFLLMTFPFYEQEWDLVGFVLETVFGEEEDEEVIEFDDDGDEL